MHIEKANMHCQCIAHIWSFVLDSTTAEGHMLESGNTKMGKYHCTVDLLFDWFGISRMTTDNFYFYLQNKLIQTSQTGGQWYSGTFPFSIPC
jgi:hypothetical protein